MSLKGASKIEFMKSEPIYEVDPLPISTTVPTMNSVSAHTTPIKHDGFPRPIGLDLTSVSVDNIVPPESKQHNRHSRRSRSKFKLENNTSREAGHTPPPRPSNHNIRSFGDLVRDTDKKEGPINWWNLKVKMPDDNTMNMISTHRIPVPTTPTTPPYIVKTPDGLRISLFDVDLDDEKKLSELGIDDDKKEYILTLKKEQEEKEKQDVLTSLPSHNNSSESDSPDEFTAKHHPDANILTVMSQPIELKPPKKRSKTPHDPSTPTLVTFDFGAGDDPYTFMENEVQSNLTHEFHAGRISLQDMRLYQSAHVNRHMSQPAIHNNEANNNSNTNDNTNNELATSQSVRRRNFLSDTTAIKRHSEIIRSKTARKSGGKRRKSRRKSRGHRLEAKSATNLQRSASVDGPPKKTKKLKDRSHKKRNSSNKFTKKKKRRKPPKSDILTSRRPPQQQLDELDPINLNDVATTSNPVVRTVRVRFKSEPNVEDHGEEDEENGEEDEDQKKVVEDLIGDILSSNRSSMKENNLSIQATPTSVQSNLSLTEADPEIEEELDPPITIKKPMAISIGIGIGAPVIQLPNIIAKSADAAYEMKDEDEEDEDDGNLIMVDSDGQEHAADDRDNDHKEDDDEEEDDDDEEEEDSYEDDEEEYEYEDSDDSYLRHRYDSSSSDSLDNNLGPLKNPFAIEEISAGSPDTGDHDVPARIDMPAKSNVLNLGIGVPAVFIVDGGVVQSGAQSTVPKNADKHLAHSPLIMNSDDAVSAFFAQYIPAFYTSNPWMLSPTFEIAQYKDLKNLNLFIYKTLRLLEKDDSNHPTQPRNIKMKNELDWDLRIDGIASCYISDELMTNVIHYVSFPRSLDPKSPKRGFNVKGKNGKKHLLGLIKSTQSLLSDPVSPVTTKLKNGYSTTSNVMANSVTHTPRQSNISVGTLTTTGSRRDTGNKLQIDDTLMHLSVNTTGGTPNKLSNTNTPNNIANGEDVDGYYDNESDHDHHNLLLVASEQKHRNPICACCAIHNMRRSLNDYNTGSCRKACHSLIYNVFYKHGRILLFLLIYFAILMLAICERIYVPLLPYAEDLSMEPIDINQFVIVITGRVMLTSLILMLVSRMIAFQSWLMDVSPHRARYLLDYFLCNRYAHLILSWFGIFCMMLIHVVFVWIDTYALDVLDIIRMSLALVAVLCLVVSNGGGTYYSLYSISFDRMQRHPCCNRCESVLCNKTFDYGQQKHTSGYKLLHMLSGVLLLIVFYLDIEYVGVYYVLSLFVVLWMIDRCVFLFNPAKSLQSTDLNIIPIDHQFKILFVNNNDRPMMIEPGDIYYISPQSIWSFGRPAVFFSKNTYNSIGCIMRVHRNNTLSNSMERVKWNFNFLERILDNEFIPVLRGPYRNNSIYHKLIENIHSKEHHSYSYSRRRSIQYLIAVDEGIAYQIEYLTYLQYHQFVKMPFPTHIIFATSSKALFNYISTNLQLLFIEMEDLTVECKLLPSNINLIPNVDEMVTYYKNDRAKRRKKEKEKQQQKFALHIETKEEEEEPEEEPEDEEDNDDDITAHDVMQEMEYDILHYLSIPHILYHHNLKRYYEAHKDSKLSTKLHDKYEHEVGSNSEESEMHNATETSNKPFDDVNNEDIGIEMYYSGIPFVSNCLNNVCKICRIPYYTQNIY